MRSKLPHILFGLYLVYFVLLGIQPYSRAVWVTENIPMVAIVLVLAATYSRFRFSNTSYLLMSVLVFLHTTGGHYTFELVPFGCITDLCGFSRNHFDRIAHFTVGFYAYPIGELIQRKGYSNSKGLMAFTGITAILAVAAAYEIFEWIYAIKADPAAGIAVLGSQGDIWDAQKDMLSDGLGAVCAAVFFLLHFRAPAEGPANH